MNGLGHLLRAGLLAGAVAACSPVISSHGYAPPDEQLSEITPGVDTRGSVRRKIGRPGMDGVFTENGWYYVSTKIERLTYHRPKVIDRRVVAVTFDENDLVSGVNAYGLEDGRVIDLVTRTTPTSGRELTILQQLLGNIGVANPLGDESESN